MNRAPKTAGLILDSPGAARTGAETAPLAPESKEAYINRELSWLHFTRRVMALAEDRTVPSNSPASRECCTTNSP